MTNSAWRPTEEMTNSTWRSNWLIFSVRTTSRSTYIIAQSLTHYTNGGKGYQHSPLRPKKGPAGVSMSIVKASFSLNSKMESNPTKNVNFYFYPQWSTEEGGTETETRRFTCWALLVHGRVLSCSYCCSGGFFFSLVCTKCVIVSITPKEDIRNKQFIVWLD
jgi:hypothetical protein